MPRIALPPPRTLCAIAMILGAALLAPKALPAQVPTPATRLARAVSDDVFLAHVEYLSDDLLEGRAPATRGGELAAK